MNTIYISEIHTPLGYHLVDLLRTDHIDPSSPTLIIGSSTQPAQSPIHRTFNFSQVPQVCCRAVMDCDIVVLDLQSPSHEAEVIIKFLENSHNSLPKPLTLIGLSSLMTWEGLRAFQLEKEGEREKTLSAIIDESSWRRLTWSDCEYQRRVPNNFYVRTYQLENMLLKLNKFDNISASVLSHGMLYGRQNSRLQQDILSALDGKSLSCFGSGDNMVPLTHVQTLLESIQLIINKKQADYAIVCDSSRYSQRQIKQIILQATGNTSPICFKETLYLSKEQCDWSINLTATPGKRQLADLCSKRNFQDYAKNELLEDFCDYNCYKPQQYVVFADKFEEKELKSIVEQLKQQKLIVQQELEKIDQQIIVRMTPPEPQITNKNKQKNSVLKPALPAPQKQPVHYYKQAWRTLLTNKKYHNFIIVCKAQPLSFIDNDLLFDHLVQILPSEPEQEAEYQQNCIVYGSQEYFKAFDLPKPSSIIPLQQSQTQFNEANEKYQFQASARKDDQLVLLNQYLLDNVLLPISEAKFALKSQKKQPTLQNFISQLKQILAKNTSRAVGSSQ